MKRILILVILSTILLASCNKASSPGNADLLEALKTLLNQVHSSSFTYPDKSKAYYQNSSSEITQEKSVVTATASSSQSVGFDLSAPYFRDGGSSNSGLGSEAFNLTYDNFQYLQSDGTYIMAGIFNDKKTYQETSKENFEEALSGVKTSLPATMEEKAKTLYALVEWDCNYGLVSSSSATTSTSGSTQQKVTFSAITLTSLGNLRFTQSIETSAGGVTTNAVTTMEFASYLPTYYHSESQSPSSSEGKNTSLSEEAHFSWDACPLFYPNLDEYSLNSQTGGIFF